LSVRQADIVRLAALTTIWSLSFVFLRLLVPTLGPVWTSMLRTAIAGIALVLWFAVVRLDADVKRHWRAYLFVGVLNSALPFLLFAYAALHLPASYLVLLNAATPMFGALAAAAWLAEPLTPIKLAGLLTGAAGVALVSRAGPVAPDAAFALAVGASLAAALCYALSGVWLKKRGAVLNPVAVAGWSQLLAGVVLVPIAAFAPMPQSIGPVDVANMLALSLLGSAVAYLLYFRLIADVGPTRAMTVTFLMPALGMVWGVVFLGETITLPMLAGAALIVAGTATVLRPPRLPRMA
jgi:drug/metabolite transporter (DMT)-like permease